MSSAFTARQLKLLEVVCGEGENAYLFGKAVSDLTSADDVERICSLISNEMMMNGIDERFEPTDYGKELEMLLDVVNRKRLII